MASPLLTGLVLAVATQRPDLKDEDVTAGWTAFAVFILLILAVAFLGWSLSKQLKKAQAAKDAGVYGPDEPDTAAGSDAETEKHETS
jgi:hypothetical protein